MSSALALYNAVRGSSSTPDTKKQVDFITDLPLEVVLCYIVPRIVMDDFYLPKPLPCFQVCRAWNERIVPVLTGIPFYMRFNEGLWSTDDWMFVESVTPYIKSLFIGKTTPFIISQLARRLQFPSINDLTLTGK